MEMDETMLAIVMRSAVEVEEAEATLKSIGGRRLRMRRPKPHSRQENWRSAVEEAEATLKRIGGIRRRWRWNE